MNTIHDVVDALARLMPPGDEARPTVLEVSANTYTTILTTVDHRPAHPITGPLDRLTGLDLRINAALPDGVWRALDQHGCLVRDSRSPR